MERVTVLSARLLLLPLLVRLVMAQTPFAPPLLPSYTITDLGPMTVGAIDNQNVKAGPTALNGSA